MGLTVYTIREPTLYQAPGMDKATWVWNELCLPALGGNSKIVKTHVFGI